ncbi:alpha/beta fold hydrolase [Streptomyces zhihengii]|uniref:alpha/beta fold hydrolase n=1 Tax=Streptomyces zhihengii TaxID=1818004 RepID=UPI001FCFED3F|nr:alpha/beta fold hydrolase [Streptomyces zhihengii]
MILGPSLGTSHAVWNSQLPWLTRRFRVLCFDLPGHGGSATGLVPASEPGRTTVQDLASLILDLANHHRWSSFHYAGISLGGAIGAHLALHQPERIASLALVCSSAHFGPAQPWQERARLVRRQGTTPLLRSSPDRWFATTPFAGTHIGRRLLDNLAKTDPTGYAACCDALATYDLRSSLAQITTPTLVVAGSQDSVTPVQHARELAEGIPNTVLEVIDCGHLAAERPHALQAALTAHLITFQKIQR